MPSNTARVVAGRLLEIRAAHGYRSVADVDALFGQVGKALSGLPAGGKHVTVADWRQCPIMAPDAAERIVEQMSGVNPSTVRSAAIANPESPVTVMQFLRVVRESKLADRKLFFDVSEMTSWLDEVLDEDERKRLRAFLDEGAASPVG